MSVLIAIAAKSLLVAGLTLGLLALLKSRSAAERSWVAHIGLLSLVIMAFAPLALPAWNVEAPAILGKAPSAEMADTQGPAGLRAPLEGLPAATSVAAQTLPKQPDGFTISASAAPVLYALPAAILLLITAIALARLFALRARADVLVDGHWLSALARAQRRMGFKHGTALLTSNELASPVSWGLMRPVILLNTRAVEASGEAEAIIAHELAHVARMDWAKLLLARVATALFWFNPLVWLLAREAHQLREEAADDAVLSADIADTDYAQLLVGVARHECPGLLLGAHGVAPSKGSLARRVARVLDGSSVRGPAARSFAAGVFVGALMIAAPLAALTLTPGGTKAKTAGSSVAAGEPASIIDPQPREVPADLPHLIASGVSTSVATAAAAIAPTVVAAGQPDFESVAPSGAKLQRKKNVLIATSPDGSSAMIYPPDARGISKVVATGPDGETAVTYMNAADLPGVSAVTAARSGRDRQRGDSAVDRAIEIKALGVTPQYIAAMRAVSPALRDSDLDDLVELKAVGVTPDYVREMAGVGFGNLDSDELKEARAVGVTADYTRRVRATGVRVNLDDLVELRALGVTADELVRARASRSASAERLRELLPPKMKLKILPSPPPPPPPVPDDPDDE